MADKFTIIDGRRVFTAGDNPRKICSLCWYEITPGEQYVKEPGTDYKRHYHCHKREVAKNHEPKHKGR